MPGILMDNRMTRSVAQRLEVDHNRMLGIRATMRLARAYNHVGTRQAMNRRRQLQQSSLESLLQENGAAVRPVVAMEDGWAVDTSRTLPHLDQMIADAQKVIEERGGVRRGGGDRSFFQQLLTDEHIERFPSLLNFATSTDVLTTVIDYMQMIPVLSVSKPLGVRLNESDQNLSEPTNGVYRESQLFHRDYHDEPMVYVIVTLRDVTMRSGPFSILPASTSARASKALRYGQRGRPYRITDEQMYAAVDRDDLFEFACPAGSVLFVDSSSCFHYGSRDAEIPRYLMMYAYVSVSRTDFGNILRKESPTPVLDDSARTCRAKYPVQPDASRLQRLVLDRSSVV